MPTKLAYLPKALRPFHPHRFVKISVGLVPSVTSFLGRHHSKEDAARPADRPEVRVLVGDMLAV
jgi:hypothetical protein